MADIPSALKKIQVEETKYKGSISEATMTRIGASINYILDEFINVPVTELTLSPNDSWPNLGGEVRVYIPFDCTLRGIGISYSGGTGTGSQTITCAPTKNGAALGSGSFSATLPAAVSWTSGNAIASFNDSEIDDLLYNFSSIPTYTAPEPLVRGDYLGFDNTGLTTNKGVTLTLYVTKTSTP